MKINELKFADIIPGNNKKLVDDRIKICCDCGSLDTTIFLYGIYCTVCKSSRLFKGKSKNEYHNSNIVLNFEI